MYEENISNALVHQKDYIISLTNEGAYTKAYELLSFVEELWKALDYGYKIKELKERVEYARTGY